MLRLNTEISPPYSAAPRALHSSNNQTIDVRQSPVLGYAGSTAFAARSVGYCAGLAIQSITSTRSPQRAGFSDDIATGSTRVSHGDGRIIKQGTRPTKIRRANHTFSPRCNSCTFPWKSQHNGRLVKQPVHHQDRCTRARGSNGDAGTLCLDLAYDNNTVDPSTIVHTNVHFIIGKPRDVVIHRVCLELHLRLYSPCKLRRFLCEGMRRANGKTKCHGTIARSRSSRRTTKE